MKKLIKQFCIALIISIFGLSTVGCSSESIKPDAQNYNPGVYKNSLVRITTKSLKKTENTMKLVLLYENITDENQKFSLCGSGDVSNCLYLIDENGNKWILTEAENIKQGRATVFPPGLPINVELTFIAKGNPNGKTFTAVLKHDDGGFHDPAYPSDKVFQAVIRGIPLSE